LTGGAGPEETLGSRGVHVSSFQVPVDGVRCYIDHVPGLAGSRPSRDASGRLVLTPAHRYAMGTIPVVNDIRPVSSEPTGASR